MIVHLNDLKEDSFSVPVYLLHRARQRYMANHSVPGLPICQSPSIMRNLLLLDLPKLIYLHHLIKQHLQLHIPIQLITLDNQTLPHLIIDAILYLNSGEPGVEGGVGEGSL